MERMLTFAGMIAGSALGGWLGAKIGLMSMVVLSSIGAGLGFYLARRFLNDFLD